MASGDQLRYDGDRVKVLALSLCICAVVYLKNHWCHVIEAELCRDTAIAYGTVVQTFKADVDCSCVEDGYRRFSLLKYTTFTLVLLWAGIVTACFILTDRIVKLLANHGERVPVFIRHAVTEHRGRVFLGAGLAIGLFVLLLNRYTS